MYIYLYEYMRCSTVCSKCFKLYMQIIHDYVHSQSIRFIIVKYTNGCVCVCGDEAKLLRVRHMGTSQSITIFVLFLFYDFFSLCNSILWNGVRSGSNKIISCEPATTHCIFHKIGGFFLLFCCFAILINVFVVFVLITYCEQFPVICMACIQYLHR